MLLQIQKQGGIGLMAEKTGEAEKSKKERGGCPLTVSEFWNIINTDSAYLWEGDPEDPISTVQAIRMGLCKITDKGVVCQRCLEPVKANEIWDKERHTCSVCGLVEVNPFFGSLKPEERVSATA